MKNSTAPEGLEARGGGAATWLQRQIEEGRIEPVLGVDELAAVAAVIAPVVKATAGPTACGAWPARSKAAAC